MKKLILLALCAMFAVGCSKTVKKEKFEGSVDGVTYQVFKLTNNKGNVAIEVLRKCGEVWITAARDEDYQKNDGLERIVLFQESGVTSVVDRNDNGTWLLVETTAKIYNVPQAEKYFALEEAKIYKVIDALTKKE